MAERFGAINPRNSTIDLRILQDVGFLVGGRRNTPELSLDTLNVAILVNSDWGVRSVANPAATSPLTPLGFDLEGEPIFDFTGAAIRRVRPFGVDIGSGARSAGMLDDEKLHAFMDAVRSAARADVRPGRGAYWPNRSASY